MENDAALRTGRAGHGDDKDLLTFLTCGSVDDGKSTLIGRLLHDTGLLLDDQIASLQADSRRYGSSGDDMDFALLVDGLEAERQQGITIDVAYRFFATGERSFVVADAPGHEQYTRNMATGASNADLAVLLVDARKGVLTQTRRHSFIASLLGIRHVVLAVNKIDLVDFSQEVFDRIVADYRAFAGALSFQTLQPIPLSARLGDNVSRPSERLAWYEGPSLLRCLETVDVRRPADDDPFRMPVQWVNRVDAEFRGYAGTVAGGTVRAGDTIALAPSGRGATVRAITTYDGDRPEARAGEAVTITLAEHVDIARGDMLCDSVDRPQAADQFSARIIWMHDDALIPGRPYILKIAAKSVGASVTTIKHTIDVNSFKQLAARSVGLNEVAVVNLSLQEPIAFDPYAENRTTGGFILIDRLTNLTVGAGMIDFALRRAENIHWQALDLTKAVRAQAKGQKAAVLWFTGLSGAGKSTIANLVEKRLFAMGRHTYLLDGDNVRHGLNRDLGFTEVDRVENIRRVAETAKLMADAGLIVLASFISPFRADRRMAREMMEPGEFVELFVDTPLDLAEKRDPKGLYKRARAGGLANFTGIDSPYEPPENPQLRLTTADATPESLADAVVIYLKTNGYID